MLKIKIEILLFFLIFTNSCSIQKHELNLKENISENESEAVNISFCELVKSPEIYKEKLIKLKGIYLLVYHYPRFISFECESEKPIIMSYEKTIPCDEKSELEEFDFNSVMADRAHGVIVIGKFNSEPKTKMVSFGKVEYFNFEVKCFEKIQQLGWLTPNPTKQQLKRIKDFQSEF